MAIDQVPEQETLPVPGESSSNNRFFVVFVVLAVLAVGEIYTLAKLSSLRGSLQAQQAQMQKELTAKIQEQMSSVADVQRSNARQLDVLKTELNTTTKRTGSTGGELRRARDLVKQLQEEHAQQAEELKHEIALKADQTQLGALSQDVTTQRGDLEKTKKSVDSLANDLGMARSELGTLIARNHDEIEQLRKLGERDYFEFTLERNRPVRIANVGLTLKKTNLKRHRFSLSLVADDMEIEKKDRTLNEPIFFYVSGSKKPYELVVNNVQSSQVKGYVSAPKGAAEVATRSEGAR